MRALILTLLIVGSVAAAPQAPTPPQAPLPRATKTSDPFACSCPSGGKCNCAKGQCKCGDNCKCKACPGKKIVRKCPRGMKKCECGCRQGGKCTCPKKKTAFRPMMRMRGGC